MTECTHAHQEERRHDETPAHTINVKSFVTSAGESQVVDITPVCLAFVDHGVKVSEAEEY